MQNAQVGKLSTGQTVAGTVLSVAAAGAQGAFSYALFTGKWIFQNKHPVWGVIFALGALNTLGFTAASLLTDPDKA